MPLTLITGPANAAKAGAVLERFRAALARDPVLVVPTSADVQHYQRELAAEGIVLGAEVLTFNWLVRAIAEATGTRSRVLGPVARERVVRAAVADTRLEVLARSAARPGFAAAAGALFAELGRSLVGPARFAQALRDWPEAPAHAGELAAMFSAYHRRLERLGSVDGEGLARAALDALRERPAAWGARPVFLYGFDDLTALQRDAVETLARHADVCVALAYEPGRAAFADRAATVELLKPLAERHELLEDRSEHYAANARDALHHLERGLFEPAAGRRPPNGAVRLLEAGGERAEAELVAAEILELTGSGVLPEDIAVLVRGGAAEAGVLGQVLEGYGVPVSLERRIPLGRTRLGAGVLAAARAALPGGTAADVLTWLRTPGRLADPDAADALEAHVRRAELTTAAEARRAMARLDRTAAGDAGRGLAEADGALVALAAAAGDGPEAFLGALVAEAEAIWTAPHRRAAAVLGPDAAADARAAAALRKAADELRALAAADPALAGAPQELPAALADVPVREPAVEGAVLVADPLAIRARRFRAVFVCGLQEGAFPRHPMPEPFLDDAARASLARATRAGARPPRGRPRARALPALRGRVAPRGGAVPLLPLVRRGGRPGAAVGVRRRRPRALHRRAVDAPRAAAARRGHVAAGGGAHPARAAARARAVAEELPEPPPLGAPLTEPVLGLLAARETEAARGLENFAGCGVRWLIESVLRPERAEPDPEPMRRGSIAHAVLEQVLRRLGEREGSARLTPASLPAALEELDAAMADRRAAATGTRARASLRELEVDLRRLLRHEAETGPALEPRLARVELRPRAATSTGRCRWRAPAWASPAASTGSTSTPAAARWCATTRAAR